MTHAPRRAAGSSATPSRTARAGGGSGPVVAGASPAASRAADASGAARAAMRRARLAQIHLARKALGLDEDTYRDLLERLTGSRSSGTLDPRKLDVVLTEFRRLGWKAAPPRGARPASGKAQVRMIRAIWRDLSAYVEDPSEAALRVFCQRQTKTAVHPDGIAAPEFLDAEQGNRVAEGLKAWLRREKARAA